MADLVSLVPVRATEMALGKPLPWPVYDWHGKLLLASGFIVENQSQLDGLIENGFFHDTRWDPQVKPSASEAPAKSGTTAAAAAAASDAKEVMIDMDDVRWSVGETLYLQLHGNPTVRYTVRMIGYVKNKTVFVTAPSVDGKFEFIREGQTFVVRAFSGKKAYAFIASAVKAVHTPHPYLHLSYPKQVRCSIVRKGARASVKIIASVTLGMPEQTAAAVLTDMSVGGASGILKEVLGAKGDEGKVVFKVRAADNEEYLTLKAVLRSLTPSENGDGFRHGFEFIDVSMRDRLILSAFVHQTLVESD
ncbi:MAG: flagellar brake protein [Herminiimonas sp.]|nr:flagellar brake protein [Herminiimonas sp.]